MKLRGLRQARQRSGLSISQLAELTGLRRETITHLEQGKEEPQSYALRRLAAALSTTTAEIVGVSVFESSVTPASHIEPPATGAPTAAAS